MEDPAPSLFAGIFDGTIWFSRRFGAGFSLVNSFGQDLYDQAIIDPGIPGTDIYPREYRGQEDLRYYRIVLRYRRTLTEKTELHAGGGLTLGGRFRDIVILHDPAGLILLSPESQFGGFATELLFARRIAHQLSIQSGVFLDFNFETTVLLPVLQMAIDF